MRTESRVHLNSYIDNELMGRLSNQAALNNQKVSEFIKMALELAVAEEVEDEWEEDDYDVIADFYVCLD